MSLSQPRGTVYSQVNGGNPFSIKDPAYDGFAGWIVLLRFDSDASVSFTPCSDVRVVNQCLGSKIVPNFLLRQTFQGVQFLISSCILNVLRNHYPNPKLRVGFCYIIAHDESRLSSPPLVPFAPFFFSRSLFSDTPPSRPLTLIRCARSEIQHSSSVLFSSVTL